MKAFVHRAVDSTVLAIVTFLLVTTVAYGSESRRDCPEQEGEVLICSGPQAHLVWLPQIQMRARACPLLVGEGAICRGPEMPDGVQTSEPERDESMFIPALSR